MKRCWKGMSASNGVDPYFRTRSRYSGVLQGWWSTPLAHGVGFPSTSSVWSSMWSTPASFPSAARRLAGGFAAKKYGFKPSYSIAMLFPSRGRPNSWITGRCADSGPAFGSRRYEAVTIRTSYVPMSHPRHDFHDVPVPQGVVRADDHLRASVNRADEVLGEVRVHPTG